MLVRDHLLSERARDAVLPRLVRRARLLLLRREVAKVARRVATGDRLPVPPASRSLRVFCACIPSARRVATTQATSKRVSKVGGRRKARTEREGSAPRQLDRQQVTGLVRGRILQAALAIHATLAIHAAGEAVAARHAIATGSAASGGAGIAPRRTHSANACRPDGCHTHWQLAAEAVLLRKVAAITTSLLTLMGGGGALRARHTISGVQEPPTRGPALLASTLWSLCAFRQAV